MTSANLSRPKRIGATVKATHPIQGRSPLLAGEVRVGAGGALSVMNAEDHQTQEHHEPS
jgi:hypothetical protein